MSLLSDLLLDWYAEHARLLPWRGERDPYAIWVSEIMLQQTRVGAVQPYFLRWMRSYPSISRLAASSEQEVLRHWEGLGYYSRARNMRTAAQVLKRHHAGRLPPSVDALRALPGIGRSTAGAIASIAFGLDEPILDGNVRRVLARAFDLDTPVDSPAGVRMLWRLAAEQLPTGRAGDYNQALMDLGATLCVPMSPRCPECPLREICQARQNGTVAVRPVRRRGDRIPSHVHAAGAIVQRGRALLAKRPSRGLLGGMWEFPNGRVLGDPAAGLQAALRQGYQLRVRRRESIAVLRHAYTHFRLTVHAFRCELLSRPRHHRLRWVRLVDLDEYPMGKVDRQLALQLMRS